MTERQADETVQERGKARALIHVGVSLPPRYQVRARLGEGGMGAVYRAFDTSLKREVAIKIVKLRGNDATVAMMRARFAQEARAIAKLDHPNIIAVHDVDVEAGWIVMELVDGEALGDLALRERPSATSLRRIADDVLGALEAAHRAGVIHRDIKPSNILIERGTGKATLADFGIARMIDMRLTMTGEAIGTPAYMSPEQLRSADVDGRSDLYSLALTLGEVLLGERGAVLGVPSAARQATLHAACGREYGLAVMIERCLSPDPTQRFASAREARAVLRERGALGTSRRRLGIAVAALLTAVALAFFALLLRHGVPADDGVEDTFDSSRFEWFQAARPHCTALEVNVYLRHTPPPSGSDSYSMRAACLALAGKISEARNMLVALPAGERDLSLQLVFDVVHPIADEGDDVAAGPVMSLVVEFQPNNVMALYHAGMSAAATGNDAVARAQLDRFLELYTTEDEWRRNAMQALQALARPAATRKVEHGSEGSRVQ